LEIHRVFEYNGDTMAKLMDEVRRLLREGQSMAKLELHSERALLRALLMLMSESDSRVRQRACWELGKTVARMNPAKIEDTIRRLMWRLNPESGDNPVGVPEALGEIGYRAPQQVKPFVSIMMQYLDDEKLRPGLLQAAGRIGQKLPETVRSYIDEFASYLKDADAVISANTALALVRIGGAQAEDALSAIETDSRTVDLFCEGEFRTVALREFAKLSSARGDEPCWVLD